MVQVSNLSKSYGTQVVFEGVDFTVGTGEHIGLVGRNGYGKTTLLRILTGEEKPDSGVISIPSDYSIGYLSQHLTFSKDSVIEEGCVGLRPSEDGRDESFKAKAVLMGLGFSTSDFSRHPLNLSGGYQVRLHLARLLVSEPNLLLLDEPTNYLDIVSIRWLTKFLKDWKGELILITHDRGFMDGVTTHTMGIHRNRIRKMAGPTENLSRQILLEEEVYEHTRLNEEKKRRDVEQFINRFRAQATRARAVQSKIKALRRNERLDKLTSMRELEFEFIAAPFTGRSLLEAKNISFSFDRECPPLINGLSLTIGKRDRIAVIGRNGAGKTTLLKLLAGELQPLAGEVMHHSQLRSACFGQTNVRRLSPERTVEEEILDAHPDHSRGAARTICGIMMFEGDSALKKVGVLSGGEKSRVLLGKLIVSPANLLLLDEPTNHLDIESVDSLLEAIEVFQGAVLIVTHSEMILHAMASRLIVFDDNRARVFEGTYQDFLDKGGWKDENDRAARNGQHAGQKAACPGKKELKRVKAQLIDDRSRTLGPLMAKISQVEEAITLLEKGMNRDTEVLITASMKGDGEAIRQMSMAVHESRGKIDLLFDELETLSAEVDARSREFEEQFEALKAMEERK